MTISKSFDADVLKEIRDHVRTFIKLDLAYLAAFGVIVTALKIGRNELVDLTAFFWPMVIIPYVFVCFIDVSLDTTLFKIWLKTRISNNKVELPKIIHKALDLQPIFHTIFFCGLIFIGVSIARIKHEIFSNMYTRASVQESVESYIAKKGSAPKSIDELKNTDKYLKEMLNKLGSEGVRIEAVPGLKYQLVFAGFDKKFGTIDDIIANDYLQLREFSLKIKKDNENSENK